MNRQADDLAVHQPWLRRLARRLARSSARADDLVQETYVAALRNAPPDVQLRPWLHAVMRRLAWGQVRSERRRAQREEGFSHTTPPLTLPDPLLDHGIDRGRLAAALAALPEPFHSTIVQCFVDGRSCADIARIENVPAGTVRWRQARGLELLRAELTVPRRRFVIWAVPFLGAGERLVTRVWQTVSAQLGRKGLWLWLALAAVVYTIIGSAAPPSATERAAGSRSASRATSAAYGLTTALTLGTDDDALAAMITGRAAPPVGVVTHRLASDAFPRVQRTPPAARDASFDLQLEDCAWDPVNGWSCAPRAGAPTSMDPTCATIRRQLLATAAFAPGSPSGSDIVAAAMLANRALAQRLGCPAVHAGAGGKATGTTAAAGGRTAAGGGKRGSGDRPECVTEISHDGTPCTVCPGAAPVCAPAECQSHMRADGVMCTTCVDAHGATSSDCPDDAPMRCRSYLADSGLVCSSCNDLPGVVECLPAECTFTDRCVSCADPKGRVAVDCSVDYTTSFTGSSAHGSGSVTPLASCSAISGVPRVSGLTCHYPGENSCVVSGNAEWHCLSCEFPDRSSLSWCMEGSVPIPDPLELRPAHLPAPGTCAIERDADGAVVCATCTHEDMSATTSCQRERMPRCTGDVPELPDPDCAVPCVRFESSRENMCASPRTSARDAPASQ